MIGMNMIRCNSAAPPHAYFRQLSYTAELPGISFGLTSPLVHSRNVWRTLDSQSTFAGNAARC